MSSTRAMSVIGAPSACVARYSRIARPRSSIPLIASHAGFARRARADGRLSLETAAQASPDQKLFPYWKQFLLSVRLTALRSRSLADFRRGRPRLRPERTQSEPARHAGAGAVR